MCLKIIQDWLSFWRLNWTSFGAKQNQIHSTMWNKLNCVQDFLNISWYLLFQVSFQKIKLFVANVPKVRAVQNFQLCKIFFFFFFFFFSIDESAGQFFNIWAGFHKLQYWLNRDKKELKHYVVRYYLLATKIITIQKCWAEFLVNLRSVHH